MSAVLIAAVTVTSAAVVCRCARQTATITRLRHQVATQAAVIACQRDDLDVAVAALVRYRRMQPHWADRLLADIAALPTTSPEDL